jgi:3-oxoacyl-[acyl-carrier protein] reductase
MTAPAAPAARDLDGKVALVVGGSRNMGAEFAVGLAGRGATTVITYGGDESAAQKTLARLEEHGVGAEAVRADATDAARTEALFAGVAQRHGRLDIVVHLPGMVLKKPLADCSDTDYDQVVDRNLRSVFLSLRAALRHLSDGGRYVVLSTTMTSFMPGRYGLYAAGKAGVEQLVRAAAREAGARGITVNAVAPGPVDTPFFHGAETAESTAQAAGFVPQNRLGSPSDIAPLVGFLVGDGAGWVNGQTLRVNGGLY